MFNAGNYHFLGLVQKVFEQEFSVVIYHSNEKHLEVKMQYVEILPCFSIVKKSVKEHFSICFESFFTFINSKRK